MTVSNPFDSSFVIKKPVGNVFSFPKKKNEIKIEISEVEKNSTSQNAEINLSETTGIVSSETIEANVSDNIEKTLTETKQEKQIEEAIEQQQEEVVENKSEVITEEHTKQEKTVIETENTEPVKKKRRGRAKKEQSEEVEVKEPVSQETIVQEPIVQETFADSQPKEPEEKNNLVQVKYGAGSVTLQDIADKFILVAEDENWDKFEADIKERINNIKITADINYGSARILIEQTTELTIILKEKQGEINAMYNTFFEKSVGLIAQVKAVNNIGKNAEERNKNSYDALMSFKWGNKKINLCDFALAINTKRELISTMMDIVECKKNALYSYLAIMKMEAKTLD